MKKSHSNQVLLGISAAAVACAGIVFWAVKSGHEPTASAAPGLGSPSRVVPEGSGERRAEDRPAVVEGDVVPTHEAVEEAPSNSSSPTTIRSRSGGTDLSTIGATFLSEDPDAVGLLNALRTLADSAVVAADTVREEEDGRITGSIVCPTLEKGIQFTISGHQFSLEMSAMPELETEFSKRTIGFTFVDKDGAADHGAATISFKPKPGADFMKHQTGESGELPLEWALDVTAEGIRSWPRATIAHGKKENEYLVASPRSISVRTESAPGIVATFDPWLRLLRPVRK